MNGSSWTPVPDSGTLWIGVAGSLLAMPKVAVFGPADIGLKRTTRSAWPAGATLNGSEGADTNAKSAASAPEIDRSVTWRSALPPFWIDRERSASSEIPRFPKSSDIGDVDTTGVTPMPDKLTVRTGFTGSLLNRLSVAF